MKYLILFLISAATFFAIDMIWLGLIAKNFYKEKLSFIFTGQINWTAAIIFYLIYIAGVLYFAVSPGIQSGNFKMTLFNGAILGFLCYATYDLTNMATIKQWPLIVVFVDILWGAFITACVAAVSYLAATKLLHI